MLTTGLAPLPPPPPPRWLRHELVRSGSRGGGLEARPSQTALSTTLDAIGSKPESLMAIHGNFKYKYFC
jgi:hypothetical protein